ncbi:MAG: ATP-binding protein [Myxococcota bacterium]
MHGAWVRRVAAVFEDLEREELEARLEACSDLNPTDPARLHALGGLIEHQLFRSRDEIQPLVEELERRSVEAHYELGLAMVARAKAVRLAFFGDTRRALELSQQALETFTRLGNERGRARMLDFLATGNEVLGDYPTALEFAYSSLEANRALGDKKWEAWALSSIGGVLATSGDVDGAFRNLEEAKRLFEELEHLVGLRRVLARLASLCRSVGRLDEGLGYQEEALRILRPDAPAHMRGMAHAELAATQRSLGREDAAQEQVEQAIQYFAQDQDALRSEHRVIQTRLLLDQGKLQLAKTVLKAALEKADDQSPLPDRVRLHQLASELHAQLGDHRTAFEQLSIHTRLQSELLDQKSRNAIQRLQIRMETESARKEAEIHRLRFAELKEAQAHLIESEKSSLLGDIAAGLAHEVNTPLGVVSSNVSVLERCIDRMEGQSTIQAALRAVAETNRVATTRMNELVTSLRRFVRLDEAEYQRTDVVEGLESALTLLEPTLPDGIEVNRSLDPVPAVLGWPSELNQAFLALLKNAVQAIQSSGQISVRSEHEGDNVLIAVADTGVGIPEEEQRDLFEVKFSNQGSRVRLRMGLATVASVVAKHRGKIEVSSRVSEGSVFTIRLPIVPP